MTLAASIILSSMVYLYIAGNMMRYCVKKYNQDMEEDVIAFLFGLVWPISFPIALGYSKSPKKFFPSAKVVCEGDPSKR